MMQLRWDGEGLLPGSVEDPEIVDSYLLREGHVVGLSEHENRFATSVPGGGVPVEFLVAVREALPATGQWFPRVEWGAGQLGVRIRPAPPLRSSSRLWLSDLVDPRRMPDIKGPDLEVLGHLRRIALDYHCDDCLLIDLDGVVLEAANAAVVFWEDPTTVILPARTVLPSITVQQTLPLWQEAGITVARRDTRQLSLPAWCGSSLHGWAAVTHWGRGAGKIKAAPAPPVEQWNKALWEQQAERV